MHRGFFEVALVLSLVVVSGCDFINKNNQQEFIAPVREASSKSWGYIDRTGKWKINPQFAYAGGFIDDRALVKISTSEGDVYGYIDKTGKLVIPPVYSQAIDFGDGVAVVVPENSVPKIIDKGGKTVANLDFVYVMRGHREGLAPVQTVDDDYELLWGFVDTKGAIAIAPQYRNVGYFSEGKCPAQNKDGKWGYIDKSGNVVIPFKFKAAMPFINGKAVVKDEYTNKWGVIDSKGNVLIDFTFKTLLPASLNKSDYFIAAISSDKVGVIDGKTGSFVVNPVFESIVPVVNEEYLFPTKDPNSNKWGYIDLTGKWKIQPQYDVVLPFVQHLAAVEIADRYGFIDTSGTLVINATFDRVGDYFGFTKSFLAYGNKLAQVKTESVENIIISLVDYVNPFGLHNKTFRDLLDKFGNGLVQQIRDVSLVFEIKSISFDEFAVSAYAIGFPYDLIEYEEEVPGFWGPRMVIRRKIIENIDKPVVGVIYKISSESLEDASFIYNNIIDDIREFAQAVDLSHEAMEYEAEYFINTRTGHFYVVAQRGSRIYLSVFLPSYTPCRFYDDVAGIIDPYESDRLSRWLYEVLRQYCGNSSKT